MLCIVARISSNTIASDVREELLLSSSLGLVILIMLLISHNSQKTLLKETWLRSACTEIKVSKIATMTGIKTKRTLDLEHFNA